MTWACETAGKPLIHPVDEIPLEALPDQLRKCHACGGAVVRAAGAKASRRGRRLGLRGVVFAFCGECHSMDLTASMTQPKHHLRVLAELDAMVRSVDGMIGSSSFRPS
jgi:hypothetical protein